MLRDAVARGPLLEALAGCERLVLLGDVIEFRHGPAGEALEAARPVLAEIGAALGRGAEVVIVPGNHDHPLLRQWLERRAGAAKPAPLGLSTEVEFRDGDLLDALARALKPATMRAAYPGVWLREDLYATHGHYSDRHNPVPLLERLGAGLMTRIVSEPAGGPASAEDYEMTLGPLYAFLGSLAAHRRPRFYSGGRDTVQVRAWRELRSNGRRTVRGTAFRVAFPLGVAALNRLGAGPLKADVSGHALRRGGLRGFAEVIERLRIPAAHVVFGHTHRAGPFPGDDPLEWRAPAGAAIYNTGSWLLERAFLGERPDASPYRPGFCALVEEQGPPRIRNLLDATRAPA